MHITTSLNLLEGLRSAHDSMAWRRFAERYEPLVLGFARRLGFGDFDAQEIAADTMGAFVEAYWQGRYDPAKGRLRSWLFGIAHHKAIDKRREALKEIVLADRTDASGFLNSIESPDTSRELWEKEWRQHILRACLGEVSRHMSPKSVTAFELYVLRQWPVEDVADHLGLSASSIYVAKHRAMEHIRKLWAEMEEIW